MGRPRRQGIIYYCTPGAAFGGGMTPERWQQIYYLTMKMLGQPDSPEFDKYSNLSALIFNELVDSSETNTKFRKEVKLVDRYGQPIVFPDYKIPRACWGDGQTGGMTKALEAFVASLSWLSFKTLYYINSARYLHADTFLHPIRQAFQILYMEKRGVYGYDFTKSVIDKMSKTLSNDLQRVISSDRAVAISLDLPVFSAWLIMKCGDVGSVLTAAQELRNDNRIKVAREQLREVRVALENEELYSANERVQRIQNDMAKSSNQLIRDFGLKSAAGIPVNRLMQVYNTVAAFVGWSRLPQYDFLAKMPKAITGLIPRRGFSALYRDIGCDLAQIWSLGVARDRLGAAVRLLPVWGHGVGGSGGYADASNGPVACRGLHQRYGAITAVHAIQVGK